uniref:CCHC-type domain-containing protein n=1 Tax=Tanacetum cinerariifolium TaxID=118510 RepID=A0A699GQE7_TANCI|nr:hypothetical protein [Tanacetum cinerariifolium]
MSTQQDIYAAGLENHPPMLNKDNYVPWSSRIIRYARSRPNGKMIVDSIKNGPYVRRMIATPGEPDLPVPVPESLHEQTDEELTETDIKRMDADDQAIQTILLGLPEDVYTAVDSCETAKEIWERVRQMMKGSDIGEHEKKAKLFNEWEKFTSTNGESIESYYHRHFTIVLQTKNLHKADFTQIYDFLKMNHEENQQGFNAWQNGRIQGAQNTGMQSGNQNGLVVILGIANQSGTSNVVATRAEGTGIRNQARCYNCKGLGHITRNCTARPRRRDAAYIQTQLLIDQKEEAGIQLQAEEFDFMAAAGDLDEIEEEEQYTDLLEPIPKPQLVPQNDNHVTSVVPSMVHSGGTVETSSAPNEEIGDHQETIYRNLVDQVAQVNRVNSNMRATNAELKSELARYKSQEQLVEISQEKYEKLEKCYQNFVDVPSDLRTELDHTKEKLELCIIKMEKEYFVLWNNCQNQRDLPKDTPIDRLEVLSDDGNPSRANIKQALGDENPIRSLGDYSRPSHEGYKNTIELLKGNNVVPLRSDTIRIHLYIGGSYYSFPCLILSIEKECKTPQQHPNVPTTSSFPHDTQYCMENPQQAFVDYTSSRTDETRVLEVLAHAPMYNAILDKYVKSLEQGKNRLGDSKTFDTLADLGARVNIFMLYLFKKLNFGLLEETDHVFRLADGTKSYPIRIIRDVEFHIGRLKLLTDFYVIDMKKDPTTPLLVGRGFLAIANAVIDCKKAKIMVGEGITRSVFGVKEIKLGQEEAPYWTTIGKKESYKPRPSLDVVGA